MNRNADPWSSSPLSRMLALALLAAGCGDEPPPCGGAGHLACAEGQYCDTAYDCAPDAHGVCRAFSSLDATSTAEVCGCDLLTYDNEAAAREAGAGVYWPSRCECRPPRVWESDFCIPLWPPLWDGARCEHRSSCSIFGPDTDSYWSDWTPEDCEADYAGCARVSMPCDVPRGARCPRGLFCDQDWWCERPGQCRPAPASCDGTPVLHSGEPTPGCDGRSYDTPCHAYRAGVQQHWVPPAP